MQWEFSNRLQTVLLRKTHIKVNISFQGFNMTSYWLVAVLSASQTACLNIAVIMIRSIIHWPQLVLWHWGILILSYKAQHWCERQNMFTFTRRWIVGAQLHDNNNDIVEMFTCASLCIQIPSPKIWYLQRNASCVLSLAQDTFSPTLFL